MSPTTAVSCIGTVAGNSGCGAHALCLGYGAGHTNAPANSIILNAISGTFSPATTSAFYVNPLRTDASRAYFGLAYNDTTKEIVKQTNYYHSEEFTGNVYMNGTFVTTTTVYVVMNGRNITVNWGDFSFGISAPVVATVVLYLSQSNSRPYLKPKIVTNKVHVTQYNVGSGNTYLSNIVQIDRDLDGSGFWDGRLEFFGGIAFINYAPSSPSTIYNYAGSISYYSDS